MATFVDLGAVRIQEYILRTSGADEGQLRKRRGASRMIAAATDPAAFASLGLTRNEQTYAVEGVAHLVAENSSTPPESLAANALETARSALPLAYLQVSWAVADTYPEAHELMKAAREGRAPSDRTRSGALYSLPPFREDPYAVPCASCHQAASVHNDTCEDCSARDAFGAKSPTGKDASTPELISLERVSEQCGQQLKLAKDLGTLARLPLDRTKRNHLATIYADGNSVGQLFASVSDTTAAIALSGAIEEAIQEAGDRALAELVPLSEPGTMPGIVTVLAADDALITVPAAFGWTFALTLTKTFNERMLNDERVTRAIQFGGHRPTLSAGIAFTHVKSPIEVAIQVADAAMRQAKRTKPGESAIGWADLTHPGDPSSLCALTWLKDNIAVVESISGMPASQRASWERDIVAGREAHVPERDILAFLRREVRRLSSIDLALDGLTLDDILKVISMSRWWPAKEARHPRTSEEAS